jgi:RNA recognition motif-containing protein
VIFVDRTQSKYTACYCRRVLFRGSLLTKNHDHKKDLWGINLKTLFIGNLPASTKENELKNLFSKYGAVRSLRLVTDVFSGQCKGFGFIKMEGHDARAAIDGLDGKDYNGNPMRVNPDMTKKL